MGLWITDLWVLLEGGEIGLVNDGGMMGMGIGRKEETNFDFEKVFGRSVDFFEALLTGIWHGLHDC